MSSENRHTLLKWENQTGSFFIFCTVVEKSWICIFNGNGSNIIWNCRPNYHISVDETWLLFWARQNLRVRDKAALWKFSISGPGKHEVPIVPLPVKYDYIDYILITLYWWLSKLIKIKVIFPLCYFMRRISHQ